MNILVIRLSSMGDVILTTPVLSWLMHRYPSAAIYMLTDSRYVSLFDSDPRVKQVIGIDKHGDNAKQLNSLAAVAWDSIIDLQNSTKSAALRRSIGSTAPTGLFNKKHFQRFLLLYLRINCYDTSDMVVRRYLRAAGNKSAGNEYLSPTIYCNKEDTALLVNRFLPQCGTKPVLALMPFSAWKNKEWPRECFAEVGRAFAVQGWQVLVFGGPEDTGHADELARTIGNATVSVAGHISLYECGCLLAACSLALGNDTGLSHLARACGVKTGMVFGATTRHFGFFPEGEPRFCVFETPVCCRPCHPHGGDVCLRGGRICLSRIRPDAVIAGLKTVYTGAHGK